MGDGSTGAKTERMLDRRLDRAERLLPGTRGRWLAHLRHPSASWVRVPLGVLLVLGGLLGFLPVLGFWMVPLGLVLLALDVALLRRPTARMLGGGERLWGRLRRVWRTRCPAFPPSPTKPASLGERYGLGGSVPAGTGKGRRSHRREPIRGAANERWSMEWRPCAGAATPPSGSIVSSRRPYCWP